ncbi:MAG: sugar phosphate isomerase/epimerase [Ruminococcaceae bacterium]|nr:sugar phosphate isomerase/epimerase [Oscillospiraceae bacterium]
MQAIHNAIKACAMLGIPHITLHGVYLDGDTQDAFIKENLRFCRALGETAEQFGVDILIENFEDGDFGYYFRHGSEMRQFIEEAGVPCLHACWDTGHANIRGRDQYRDILDLGSHLRALHIQDNWGTTDSHVMPMVGTTNFDQILKGLTEIGYRGSFSFEAPDTLRFAHDSHHKRRGILPDDRLADPPIFLQQKLEWVKYEIGKWMLGTYGVYEE